MEKEIQIWNRFDFFFVFEQVRIVTFTTIPLQYSSVIMNII